MRNRSLVGLNSGKKLVLIVAGMAALGVPVVIGILDAPAIVRGQVVPAPRPEFEVASMKPAKGGPWRMNEKNGTFRAENTALKMLIAEAYRVKIFQIYGDPAWIASSSYDITAKRNVDQKNEHATATELFETRWSDMQLRLQTLLEDRCALKVHRETKELPLYAVSIAKGGLKLQPSTCTTLDINGSVPP